MKNSSCNIKLYEINNMIDSNKIVLQQIDAFFNSIHTYYIQLIILINYYRCDNVIQDVSKI